MLPALHTASKSAQLPYYPASFNYVKVSANIKSKLLINSACSITVSVIEIMLTSILYKL